MNKKSVIGLAAVSIVIAIFATWRFDLQVGGSQTTLPSFVSKEDVTADIAAISTSRYTHPDGLFSFTYPNGATVKSIPDESGETVVVEAGLSAAAGEGSGIQIVIAPFDEDIALTPERIKQDIPDITMNDTQTIKVDGTQAVAFTSTDASFGASAEVWLVRGGKLYQISTPDNSRALLYNLLTQWKWNR